MDPSDPVVFCLYIDVLGLTSVTPPFHRICAIGGSGLERSPARDAFTVALFEWEKTREGGVLCVGVSPRSPSVMFLWFSLFCNTILSHSDVHGCFNVMRSMYCKNGL